jgi:hypothetical protein
MDSKLAQAINKGDLEGKKEELSGIKGNPSRGRVVVGGDPGPEKLMSKPNFRKRTGT